MKRNFIVIYTIVLLLFTYGCQTSVQNEETDKDMIATDEMIEITESESTVSKDEVIKLVLETVFTVKDSDYNQNEIDYTFALEDRQNEIEQYFTDTAFDNIVRSRMILGFIYMYQDYNCTSEIKAIELDYRETSKVDEIVCYYNINHKLTFEDPLIEPLSIKASGEMTLNKYNGEWQIDFFSISNSGSYRTTFLEHVETLDLETGKVNHSRNEIDNIINQILTDSIKLRLIYDSKLNITTPEPYNYIIVFEDSQIKLGSEDGEFDSVVYYDEVKYDEDQSTLSFHINGVRKSNDDDSVIEVLDADYYDKIIISKSEIIYLHKYKSNEGKVSIWWYSQE